VNRATRIPRGLSAGLLLLAVAALPTTVAAQSDLDSSQATAFLGNWDVAIESEFGPFSMDLVIQDQGGKVAASIGSPDMGPGMQEITTITREDEVLRLKWSADAQGQMIEITIDLFPTADGLAVALDGADGMFVASGTATRASS